MGTLQVTLTEERGAWDSMFQKESQAEKPTQNIKGSLWLKGIAVARQQPFAGEGAHSTLQTYSPVPRMRQPGSRKNTHAHAHTTPLSHTFSVCQSVSFTHIHTHAPKYRLMPMFLPASLEAKTTHAVSGPPPSTYTNAKFLLCTTCWEFKPSVEGDSRKTIPASVFILLFSPQVILMESCHVESHRKLHTALAHNGKHRPHSRCQLPGSLPSQPRAQTCSRP